MDSICPLGFTVRKLCATLGGTLLSTGACFTMALYGGQLKKVTVAVGA